MTNHAGSEPARLAISWLLSDCLEDIEQSIHQQQPVSLTMVSLGDLPTHVRGLAVLCGALPAGLLAGESVALDGLRRVWDSASDQERRWIGESPENHKISVGELLALD